MFVCVYSWFILEFIGFEIINGVLVLLINIELILLIKV